MSEPAPVPSLLTHLPSCPKCDFVLSAPILCMGTNYPENKDHWYRKCLNNHPPAFSLCNHVEFTDLPPGTAGLEKIPKQCPGSVCKTVSRSSKAGINVACTFGLCLQCCKHVATNVSPLRSCAVSSHRVAGKAAVLVGGSARVPPPASAASPGHPPTSAPGYHPPSSGHQISIAAPYRQTLIDVRARQEIDAQVAAREATLTVESRTKVYVYWWDKQGAEPDIFHVEAPNWPAFCPGDCAELVEAFKADVARYQYFDWQVYGWINGGPKSKPRNLKTCGELRYRTIGVTHGIDMPGLRPSPLKRTATQIDDDELSVRRTPSNPALGSFPMTPLSHRSLDKLRSSLTPTTRASLPPATPASAASSSRSSPTLTTRSMTFRGDVASPSRDGSPFPPPRGTTPPPQHERLPSLLPNLLQARAEAVELEDRTAGPSRAFSSQAAPHTMHEDPFASSRAVSPPPGPRGGGWPLRYAFGYDFKKSTWHDNLKAWESCDQADRDLFISYGRRAEGEWTAFRRATGV
ncbi:hypothetical protein C8Q76DRAFT_695753 [Earliella scabrosa]|nr:hypothetical protein C8Q76DRAFT_695753 [Earliella scabrosa]